VREAFTWGPQTLALTAGLAAYVCWLIPGAEAFLGGAVLAAAGALVYDIRRRRRRTSLVAEGDVIGRYRGDELSYTFARDDLALEVLSRFDWLLVTLKVNVPLAVIAAALAAILFVSLVRDAEPMKPAEVVTFVWAIGLTVFGIVATLRSRLRLAALVLPRAQDTLKDHVHVRRADLAKLELG
jgi:hypothetical protein